MTTGVPGSESSTALPVTCQPTVRAVEDALHVAAATVHDMDYLLTWNCRHIANAEMRRVMRAICSAHGYEIPLICTPEELMGG